MMLDNSWLVVIAVIAGLGSACAAATQQSFLIKNTGDLTNLCSAPQTDPLHTAAVIFCEGFGLGVFETLYEEDAARRTKTICVPNPRHPAIRRWPHLCSGPRPIRAD